MPYECLSCHKRFIERANLRVHFKIHLRDGVPKQLLLESFEIAREQLEKQNVNPTTPEEKSTSESP